VTASLSPNLKRLAEAYGVITQFRDGTGARREISPQTAIRILKAFGVDAATPAALSKALTAVDRRDWLRTLPPTVVSRLGTAVELRVHAPEEDAGSLTAWIDLDDDPALAGSGGQWQLTRLAGREPTRTIDGVKIRRLTFLIPAGVPLGWHTLHTRSAAAETEATLVIVPDKLELPATMSARRGWGLMAQIYADRSRRSWGVGDFADLAELAWIAGHDRGADFVLINPVHAAEAVPPMTPSPYLPSSRAFINPIYIRPEAIEEYAYAPDDVREQVRQLASKAGKDNDDPGVIDRDRCWPLKLKALEAIYTVPRSAGRESEFKAFTAQRGAALKTFALHSALVELGEAPDPAKLPAASEAADALAAKHRERIAFFSWLQWVADGQLADAQRRAVSAGMRLGLMADLAVGVHPAGADAWALAPVLARGVSVGAPPDFFNQIGQDWSQPPWRPDALAETGYKPYRQMIRSVLAHAGAIRIDHILGLFRLWWIPAGAAPAEGCYVKFDHEAMVGIVLLEAYRVGAMIVGEDLGVSEPWVHDYLPQRGILGSKVLWFEKQDDGLTPRLPEWYRRFALSTVTVHDLPPSAAFLSGEQVDLRAGLGILARAEEEERAEAARERAAVLDMLRTLGLIPRDEPDPPTAQVVLALHRFLLATPSVLIGVSLPDAVGERRAENVPGTNNEYPNWRVPLADGSGRPVLMEDLGANPTFLAVTAAVSGR
jgi:4-alpha-glucanotransferase